MGGGPADGAPDPDGTALEGQTSDAPAFEGGGVLAHIRALKPGLSAGHARIAALILDDPAFAMGANVEDIALRAEVSAPTVVRFARRAGCAGLRDLKLRLAGALALRAPFLHRAVHVGEGAPEVLRNVTGSIAGVLGDWQRRVDPGAFERAAAAIHAARRIDCTGTGALSHFLASELQARLFRLGLAAQSFADAHYQLVAAAALAPGDVQVAISYVGRMPALLRAVELAKARGAAVIALTCEGTPLAALADILLPVEVPNEPTMLVGTEAYVVQLIAIEVLMIQVGLRLGPDLMRRMQEIQHVLRTHSADAAPPEG